MTHHPTNTTSRVQTALLLVIVGLLGVDLGSRMFKGTSDRAYAPAAVVDVAYQPGTFPNPAVQRLKMVEKLTEINSRLGKIERRLETRLRVEVTNFPKPKPEKE
ncbi:MAG TPA: hypothetical protein ENJ00_06150 [Phycisphaerales bacterium]|nr:hypothetical protein [Phycisphaerales bacterium]